MIKFNLHITSKDIYESVNRLKKVDLLEELAIAGEVIDLINTRIHTRKLYKKDRNEYIMYLSDMFIENIEYLTKYYEILDLFRIERFELANAWSFVPEDSEIFPKFFTQEYFDYNKGLLYNKDPEFYENWKKLKQDTPRYLINKKWIYCHD